MELKTINVGRFHTDPHCKDVIVEVQQNGCWHVISHSKGREYAHIYINDKQRKIHRLIYERDVEPIKPGNVSACLRGRQKTCKGWTFQVL